MGRHEREQEELRAAQLKLAAALVNLVGPLVIRGGSSLSDWWQRRQEAKRLEQERKEILLLQEETNRRAFTGLVADGRIEEARQRFPEIAVMVDPNFDAEKYLALEEEVRPKLKERR